MSHLRSSTAPGLRAHPRRHGTPLCSLQTLPSCFESTSTLPSSAQHLLAETHPNEDPPGTSSHTQPLPAVLLVLLWAATARSGSSSRAAIPAPSLSSPTQQQRCPTRV